MNKTWVKDQKIECYMMCGILKELNKVLFDILYHVGGDINEIL